MIRLCAHSVLVLLAGTAQAGDSEAPPPSDRDTVRRSPAIRAIPNPQRFRFDPQADMSAQELEQLGPYLKGKPLYDEDRKTLGPAMRHLREIK